MAALLKIAEVRLMHIEPPCEFGLADALPLSLCPDSLPKHKLEVGCHGAHAPNILGWFLTVKRNRHVVNRTSAKRRITRRTSGLRRVGARGFEPPASWSRTVRLRLGSLG